MIQTAALTVTGTWSRAGTHRTVRDAMWGRIWRTWGRWGREYFCVTTLHVWRSLRLQVCSNRSRIEHRACCWTAQIMTEKLKNICSTSKVMHQPDLTEPWILSQMFHNVRDTLGEKNSSSVLCATINMCMYVGVCLLWSCFPAFTYMHNSGFRLVCVCVCVGVYVCVCVTQRCDHGYWVISFHGGGGVFWRRPRATIDFNSL